MNQNVNFWNVPARPNMLSKIINPWPKLADGSLDMTRSPFQLAAIVANTYAVPLDWPVVGTNFLGGNSLVPSPVTTFWNAPGIANNDARHKLSLNTCNGCHGGELGTPFTHISHTGALSAFLSGPLTKVEPVVSAVSRTFNEMLGRQQHLDSVASQSCLTRALDTQAAFVH